MKRPQDFPKALSVLACASFVLFIVPAIVGYHYLGQYAEAPAFGSLQENYKKISFAFVIVPTLVIGGGFLSIFLPRTAANLSSLIRFQTAIYSNVSSKYIYQRIMGNSKHAHSNTIIGWGVWTGVVVAVWGIAFIFGEVIPSMGDFLSLLGAAFDSFYGFIFWAIAYGLLERGQYFKGPLKSVNTIFHVITMVVGLFLLGPGLYAAVDAIMADYAGSTRPAFSCKNLAI